MNNAVLEDGGESTGTLTQSSTVCQYGLGHTPALLSQGMWAAPGRT